MTLRSLLLAAPATAAVAALAIPVTAAAARAPGRSSAKNVAVAVQGFAFTPANATVALGGTVTWTFKDAVSHTATYQEGTDLSTRGLIFLSGPRTGGATFAFTFKAAGTYPYLCTIHTTM